jgi:hypothetical protein
MPPKSEAPSPYFDPIGDVSAALGALGGGKDAPVEKPKAPFNVGELAPLLPGASRLEQFTSLEHFLQRMCDHHGVSRMVVAVPMFLILVVLATIMMPNFLILSASWVLLTAPIWIVPGVPIAWWRTWVWYVRALYFAGEKYVLLEVKMPRDIMKSPRAMEAVLTELWVTSGQTTWLDRWWNGRTRPWFTFEIASFGGEVHFYIWLFASQRGLVESMMYAQYPEIEIVEAEDYSRKFVYDPRIYDLFGNQMYYLHDPEGILPIRTYLDYELEKDPKEEHKVDPMAHIIEFMSSMQKSEQAWIQILFQCMTEGGANAYRARCQKRIEELRLKGALFGEEIELTEQQQRVARARPSWRQMEQMQAIERHMGKRMFEVGVKICYIAKYEDYRPAMRNALRWIFMPYYGQWLNNLRPKRWHGDFDFPWQDLRGIRWRMVCRRVLDAWRRRSYFYPPWTMPMIPMSTEALASLWHPPARAIASPGVQRIPAKKAEPPANLPR